MQTWKVFLDACNAYGGFVSIISLLFSIWIFKVTGNIKKDMIQTRQTNKYRQEKRVSVKRLEEMVASISYDAVYDNQMKTELLVQVNKLLKYKVFIDFHSRYYIFKVNQILKKDTINSKNSSQIVSYVSKLCGRMSVEPVDTEVR